MKLPLQELYGDLRVSVRKRGREAERAGRNKKWERERRGGEIAKEETVTSRKSVQVAVNSENILSIP